ncbi:hypothetical protein BVRB_024130 [Beta vulgaris subsp. vulgaris]|uniref:NUC153 domain-containing protein n=1 Tax=Beta vulgaris subsp. vulgaris TaxID=3555 RepID=A0A0J8B2U2_BETVV|nr:hypothetical protein BVRB_024130 [Beta vulgaris subsp. vulgaris]
MINSFLKNISGSFYILVSIAELDVDSYCRDSAHEVPSNYTPTEFYTSSLKHTNMKCTWDAEDPNRKDFFQRRISNLKPDDRDIEVYLAPAESDAEGSDFVISADESDGEGNKVVLKKRARSRYLALLEEINAKADGNDADKQMGDITISFEPGLSNAGQAILDAKKKKEQIANETVWEARQRKRKEKKMSVGNLRISENWN